MRSEGQTATRGSQNRRSLGNYWPDVAGIIAHVVKRGKSRLRWDQWHSAWRYETLNDGSMDEGDGGRVEATREVGSWLETPLLFGAPRSDAAVTAPTSEWAQAAAAAAPGDQQQNYVEGDRTLKKRRLRLWTPSVSQGPKQQWKADTITYCAAA